MCTEPAKDVQKGVTQNEINIAQRNMKNGYYYWYWMHILLGLIAIILPAIAAFWHGLPIEQVKEFAGVGAVAAAIYAFVRPHELASSYDWACQHVWKTDISFNLGQIGEKEVAAQLGEAITATTFKYAAPDNKYAAHDRPKP
jgi:hypothetical protein